MKGLLTGLSVLSMTLLATAAFAAPNALKFVPEGKIVNQDENEFKVQTPNGGVIELEFDRKGELSEASGDSIENDVFVPGKGLLTLAEAKQAISKAGKSPSGEWSLDYSMVRGWYYEFNEFVDGNEVEYTVSAKDGKLLKEKVDN